MLYPLKFRPRFSGRIWGGQKIRTFLGKSLDPEKSVGESWELFDFPPGVVDNSEGWLSSEIANGPLAGRSLHELMVEQPSEILGVVKPVGDHGQFPVLIKFLDARDDLSIQVHPDEKYAATHPGAHLKTEAWYVVQNEPGAKLYKGLTPGTTREKFEKAILDGSVESVVEEIPVKTGDCYFMPSGTVHALGAGILAWEVQTPSDTTYRVFDFNRVEATTGKPRKLHVEQALDCMDFSGKREQKQPRHTTTGAFSTVSRLVTSPYFILEKVRMKAGTNEAIPYDKPVVWTMLEGEAQISVGGFNEPILIARGETVLLPARMKDAMLHTKEDCVWLEVSFPTPQ